LSLKALDMVETEHFSSLATSLIVTCFIPEKFG
jgi:hypothetical protein